MKKFFCLLSILLCFSANSYSKEFIDNLIEQHISDFCSKIIKTSQSKMARQKKIEALVDLIDNNINSKWIARFVLGKHYKNFSANQFDKFLILYREYMINSYAPKFLNYEGRAHQVIAVSNQKIFYNVKTEFYSVSSSAPISIAFRVKAMKDNNFLIIDFIAEGISLLESQRSELDSSISKDGVKGFLLKLKKKVNTLKENNKST